MLLLGYILFAPFYIEINSAIGRYSIRFHRVFQAHFYFKEDVLMLDYKIIRWGKQIELFPGKSVKNKISERSEKSEQTNNRIIKKEGKIIPVKKIHAVIKSFKVNKFHLTLSFENMALNGILFPLFELLSFKSGKTFQINFWNENKILIEVENNFYRMIRAYIKN